jgi:WD40 repeat protein
MLDKENDILIINSTKKILIANKTKLFIVEIEQEKDTKNITLSKSKKILALNFPDDILSIHHLISLNKIIVSCISNKTLYLISEEIINKDEKALNEFNLEKDALIFQSNKKMTSIISYQETPDKYFLLISDKFGEISIKPVTKFETRESFAKEIKIITGHCDTINYIKLSLDKKVLLSADNFGKIKIYNFPNIFNVLSVILYHEDEIVYTNFLGENDKGFFVINKSGFIYFWSLYDFINKNKINMDFLNEEKILEVKMLKKNEYIMIKTSKKFFVVKIDEDKYEIEKIKEIENNKENIENKFFDFNDKIFNIEINSVKNEINAINTLL